MKIFLTGTLHLRTLSHTDKFYQIAKDNAQDLSSASDKSRKGLKSNTILSERFLLPLPSTCFCPVSLVF
jgi:hypothetical protein